MTDTSITASLIVRLDDARFGAGPGTVIAIGDLATFEAMVSLRDGARDRSLRCWRSYTGAKVGDRVSL